MKKLLTFLVMSVSMALLLVGCAGQSTQLSYETVGTGDTSVLVTNKTGYDIVQIEIKETTALEYAADTAVSGIVFTKDATIKYCYTPQSAAASSSTDKAVNTTYDLRLTASDGTIIEMHQINLGNMKEIDLKYEDAIGFISYKSNDGAQRSTKESEIAYKAARDAEAAAIAEAAEAQSYSYSSSSNSYDYSASAGSGDSSSAAVSTPGSSAPSGSEDVGQSEEGCLSDVVIK